MRGLNTFKEDSFIQALKNFFEDLQVPVNYIADEPASVASILGDKYKPDNPAHKLIDDVYVLGMVDDAIFEVQNQLFKEVWTTTRLQKIDKDYDGLVIFGVTLKQREGDLLPTRSQLAEITRAFNRAFHYTPVTVVFKYGTRIAFANSERVKYKQEWREGERVGKVTMLKDVSIEKTHSGHIRILLDMQIARLGKDAVTSFSGLYKYWQKVFNVSTLNKSFYRELSNWYFYAMKQVSFPDDLEKDENIRNATNLIRLITRVIFIWFIKEKGLVPETIFNKAVLGKILKEFHKSKTSCSYYPAILQNLFFGTLNQKMDDRAFTKQGAFPQNRSEYGVKNLFRYVDLFSISEEDALNLFKDVPFLNGGLFDCLDKPDDEGKILYVDGFSRNSRKQAIVPDSLFFAEEHEVDLNEIYGTKNKKYTTKGFVEILSGYKFTVEENTPIEEEVALDPELLGKVFENLLASYNPETQTTARKQTGSFYTPREIVNYMVDESLKAYLKGHLVGESSMMEGDAQAGLDLLFAYTEKEHLFDAAETKTLISAIDRCKILDPACGSGAFPMGVLHKMVHILHKLDPNNEQWKQRQTDKVDKLIEEAQGITDTAAREQVIAGLEHNKSDIEDAFGSNELDYGRKLYLIENCIYGVDIQPIAVQIAKLRFFISLVIDQKKQPDKENFGIRALPNLETKFVAANTLIGLDRPQQGSLIKDKKIDELEKELQDLRHRYFSARTRRDKIRYQNQDKLIRQQIGDRLKVNGWDADAARQIVRFDPYDQNASSLFFDPEWMFGLKACFNIVIGNPPYMAIAALPQTENNSLSKQHYETFSKGADIYCLFYEKGISLLKPSSILAYISSNRFCFTNYGIGLRKYLSQNNILQLINFNEINVFESANVGSIVTLIQNCKPSGNTIIVNEVKGQFDPITLAETCKLIESKFYQNSQWSFDESYSQNLKCKIESMGIPFIKWKGLTINRGITTGANNVFIIDDTKRNELIRENANSKEILIPVLRGANIKRYSINRPDQYLIFTYTGIDIQRYPSVYSYLKSYKSLLEDVYEAKHGQKKWYELRKCNYYDNFSLKKLVWTRLSNQNAFAISAKGEFTVDSSSFAIGDDIEYLAAILNSKVVFYYFRLGSVIWGKDGIKWFGEYFDNIPIPNISINNKAPFNTIVNFIGAFNNISVNHVNSLTTYFERLLDVMVYELYFPDEIKAAGCEMLKHLNNLPELNGTWSDEQKLAAIEKVYRELSDPAHPVSIAMKKMQDVPEIRIIEGRPQ